MLKEEDNGDSTPLQNWGELDTANPNNSKSHHIASLAGDGLVVQAEMAVTGVHADDRYVKGAGWTARRRLKDSSLP